MGIGKRMVRLDLVRRLLGCGLSAIAVCCVSWPAVVLASVDTTSAEQPVSEHIDVSGAFTQGGTVLGRTMPGTQLRLDTRSVLVAEDGQFVLAFDRDYPDIASLYATYPDGSEEALSFAIAKRDYEIQRIDGLPPSKVTPYSAADMAKIAEDAEKKGKARAQIAKGTWFAEPFVWPVTGIITGVFGSQRVLNGEPKRPHNGVDVAATTGTDIVAPAGGLVTLAEADMFFEGGLVFIGHGHGYRSYFMHLSRVDVKPGDMVTQGQVIGAVGATGRATGPHLHWGMTWNGQRVDPELRVPPMPAKPAESADAP